MSYPQYPQGGGYPPPTGGYPSPGGYPPPVGGGYSPYPPAPGPGYPHGPGFPPPGGVPIMQPPMHGGYPEPGVGFAPAPAMMPPSSGGNTIVPPGLEYLTQVDQLIIKQKVELLEAFVGFETNNKYTVKNSMGQKVFYAIESNDCCTRNCCGPIRPFEMKIRDLQQNEVIHLSRPLRCDSCWFPCCLQRMEVCAPPGQPIGYIEQEWSIFTPKFSIKMASGQTVLYIEGPMCTWSLCGDVKFKVISATTGAVVGKISKQWSGLIKEAFTDTDNYGISFPLDLDVHVKAILLAAAFLIDFMYFEMEG